jgi:hypothetical protein
MCEGRQAKVATPQPPRGGGVDESAKVSEREYRGPWLTLYFL